MNRFVKKLLAKYVTYIEIIGYAFVILFIATLVALSYIKAEDEFVSLNGKYELQTHLIKFDHRNYMIGQVADSNTVVDANGPLFEITDDEAFITDQTILDNLEAQLEAARQATRADLTKKLAPLIYEMEAKTYPGLKINIVRSAIAGDFIIVQSTYGLIPENKVIGGVYDFDNSLIQVTEFPPDKRLKRKLKPAQTGTATLKLGPLESIQLSVNLELISDRTAIFAIKEIPKEAKLKIAKYTSDVQMDSTSKVEAISIDANINVLGGWKSWMKLIWR
jgi:hypothetical protein